MTFSYILDGKTPVPCENLTEWTAWMATADRHVAKSQIGKYLVSTVFLGVDHSLSLNRPTLFETMVFWTDGSFKDRYSTWRDRYSTWEEALKGHEEMCARVRNLEQ